MLINNLCFGLASAPLLWGKLGAALGRLLVALYAEDELEGEVNGTQVAVKLKMGNYVEEKTINLEKVFAQ